MRRRLSIAATVAALFGLQAPLCSFACSAGAASEPVAASSPAAPCHGEPAAPIEPASGDRGHDDCPCVSGSDATAVFVAEFSMPAPSGIAVAPFDLRRPLSATLRGGLATSRQTDLPPPEILLLKSTWIV